ncbi:eukaryotic translation initiation factor 2-alpha kinase 3 [Microdochium nivale]|nr:eukaryotic translation initiation factor 2-alpha kinase 3 [Microdochium nivale]
MSMFRRQTDVSTSSGSGSEYESESESNSGGEDEAPAAAPGLQRTRTIDTVTDDDDNNSRTPHSNASTDNADEIPTGAGRQDGSTSTEILFSSSGLSLSAGGPGDESTSAHRDIMLAGLLEHYYQSRALDFLNTASPGGGSGSGITYQRDSPEVQQLAGQLLAQALQTLSSGGVLDGSAIADENRGIRRQYLLGLDSIAVQGVNVDAAHRVVNSVDSTQSGIGALDHNVVFAGPSSAAMKDLVIPVRDMAMRLPYLPHPANDLQLTMRQPHSHYKMSFQEMSFLGKGGFGSVFKCWNRFDNTMYAVKKIPLSPRLSKSFCEGGHDRLDKLLREVRALATFDHSNIVRYHATWIEEPSQSAADAARQAGPSNSFVKPQTRPRAGQPKLLEHHPIYEVGDNGPSFSDDQSQDVASDIGGIVFGFDTGSGVVSATGHSFASGPQISEGPFGNRVEELSSSSAGEDDSDIFTDGDDRRQGGNSAGDERSIIPTGIPVLDPTVHVLHIQMSLYPMTLAQYLSPTARPPTHCFHLVPSLRLLLCVLTGLQYIHSKGLVHRDIKPGNIFLMPSGPNATESAHGGYCNVGDCEKCSSTTTTTENIESTSISPATSSLSTAEETTTSTRPPLWLNPRIGDFGLVTQLAKGGLSAPSPDALEQQLRGQYAGEVTSSDKDDDDKVVGTMYYRPPRWMSQATPPASPGKQKGRQQRPPPSSEDNEREAAQAEEHGQDPSPESKSSPQAQQPPSKKKSSPDEKLDIFALGVVFVEMLSCCNTAMQRVDMLKAIQEGRPPVDEVRRCCSAEMQGSRQHEQGGGDSRQVHVTDQVVALVEGMLALDPEQRWDGSRVRAAVEGVLSSQCVP